MSDTYPYSIQRTDHNGVPSWAVWKNDEYKYVTPRRDTIQEAETDLHNLLNKD